MKRRSKGPDDWDTLREKIIGLGETSIRKSYYPELQQRLADLELFRTLLDQSPDAIFLARVPTGALTDVNQSACSSLGYSREELLLRSLTDLIAQPESTKIAVLLTGQEEKGDGFSLVVSLSISDGRSVPAEMTLKIVESRGEKYAVVVARDITERKQAEAALRMDEERLEVLLALNNMTDASERELTHFAMEAAVSLTNSTVGYVAFMNEDETVLTMQAWSKQAMEECAIIDKPRVYPVVTTGLWGEAVRQRKAVITNDYAAPNPWKKGTPDGHVLVTRHMNVPTLDGDRIVIVAGVGNKPSDYGNDDIRQISLLMSGLWTIIHRKRAEEALRRFERAMEYSTDAVGMSTPQGHHYYQNAAFSKMFGKIGEYPPETLYVDKKIGDEVFQMNMAGGQWTGEVKMYSTNREILDIYLRAYATKDINGNITALVGIHTDITERKKAEEAVLQSEKKFSAAFMASPDSLVLARVSDGRIIEVNEAFLNTIGYSREEVIGKTARELENWTNPEHRKNYIATLLGTGAVNGMDTAFRAKDGRIIPAIISGRLLEIHGEMCSISIAHDISEIKHAEVLIRESEEKYRTLVNNLNVGIFRNTGGPHGQIIQANPAMIRMYGYDSLEEFLEIPVSDLYQNPDDRKLYIEEIQRTGYAKDKELAQRKKDGSLFWVSVSATAQYDENGDIRWTDGVVEDITERKKVAAALRESEQRLRIILHGSPIPAFVIGKDHRVIHWNEALEQLSGIRADSVIGTSEQWKAFYDHERPCMADLIVDVLFKAISEWYPGKYSKSKLIDDAYEATDFFPALGDKGKWLRFTAAPIRNAEGDLIGAIETLEDITDSILAEEERIRLEDQLAQAQKMEAIGTLAGGIAHDFNNILAAIIGYSELALSDVTDPEKAKAEINEVIKAGDRAKNLVGQILTFSRKTDIKYSPLELPTLIKESLKMLRSAIPTTIEIRQDLIKSALIMSDPTQIHQLMLNLCTNAAYAMDETGGVLSVSLCKENVEQGMVHNLDVSHGPFLRLRVSDTGHGMTPEVTERIFEPYYSTKEPGRGTGLGLSVVHGIVKSHGGAITCKSEPGKGTTFDIYLPELELETEAHELTKEEPLPTGTERILFVDDEPAITSIAEKMLGKLGYDVTTMNSSLKAHEIFKTKPDTYNLVITDMTMPGMTGDKLAQKIMEIRPDIPVILCTGYSDHISAEKAKSIGIREYVMKPLQLKILAHTIRKVLDA